MSFRFSFKVTLICGLLIYGMIRASIWQWHRYVQKQSYIEQLATRLELPPAPLFDALEQIQQHPENWNHRRVLIEGDYDFDHEMVLRNRRYQEFPGVHVLTPLILKGSELSIIVDRGFVPLTQSSPEARKKYQRPAHAQFVGLLKESAVRRFFWAPNDPESGAGHPWVDAWLRVDLPKIGAQLPYPILPLSLEIMPNDDLAAAKANMINTKSGRDEMFFLGQDNGVVKSSADVPDVTYPIPTFDTVVPAGRHYEYVWEWGIMALITFVIMIILQFRRPTDGDNCVVEITEA